MHAIDARWNVPPPFPSPPLPSSLTIHYLIEYFYYYDNGE